MDQPPRLNEIEPMLLTERRSAFSDPDWIFELKHDGDRVLAGIDDGQVELRTRNGAECTRWYPEVIAGLATVTGGRHVLDGEVCVLDDIGRSSFDRLQTRFRTRRWKPGADPVAYMAFDMLVLGGMDIRSWPVERRKSELRRLLTPAPDAVLFVDHVRGDGELLYAQAVALQMEGVVAKRLGSAYASGARNGNWLKFKRRGAVPAQRFKV